MKPLAVTFITVALLASPLVAADRLSDKDVKVLVDRIDEGRSRFKDALDDKIKKEVLRGRSQPRSGCRGRRADRHTDEVGGTRRGDWQKCQWTKVQL